MLAWMRAVVLRRWLQSALWAEVRGGAAESSSVPELGVAAVVPGVGWSGVGYPCVGGGCPPGDRFRQRQACPSARHRV